MALGPFVRRAGRRLRPVVAIWFVVAVVVGVLLVGGWHWARLGWRDKHIGYFDRPSGYAEVVQTFGQPCNTDADAIELSWTAADNGVTYTPNFHRKLGGMKTEMVTGQGGSSTNLDNDVHGHVQNNHKSEFVKSGIWGYVCRYIAGTTLWSTHAWGIAIDVSAAHEHYPGHYHSHVNWNHAGTWQNHGWYWGKAFGDAMHFQYADLY